MEALKMAKRKTNVVNLKTHSCATPGCPGKVGDQSITGLCRNCYSCIYRWSKQKTKTEGINYFKRMTLSMSRIDLALPQNDVEKLHAELDSNTRRYTPLVVMPGQVKTYRKRNKSRYKTMSRERITNYS